MAKHKRSKPSCIYEWQPGRGYEEMVRLKIKLKPVLLHKLEEVAKECGVTKERAAQLILIGMLREENQRKI